VNADASQLRSAFHQNNAARTELAGTIEAERLWVGRRIDAGVILSDDERASLVLFSLLGLLDERLDRLPLRPSHEKSALVK
jgi:hypothetical protein